MIAQPGLEQTRAARFVAQRLDRPAAEGNVAGLVRHMLAVQAQEPSVLLGAGRGMVVLGPERDGKPTYVHAADWLGTPLPVEIADRDAAMRALIARYRAARNPCTPATWLSGPACRAAS